MNKVSFFSSPLRLAISIIGSDKQVKHDRNPSIQICLLKTLPQTSLETYCIEKLFQLTWGGRQCTEVVFAHLTQLPLVRFSAFPKSICRDVAEIWRRHFVECEQLKYLERTHLERALSWCNKKTLTVDNQWLLVHVVDRTEASLVRVQAVFEAVQDEITRQVAHLLVLGPTNPEK